MTKEELAAHAAQSNARLAPLMADHDQQLAEIASTGISEADSQRLSDLFRQMCSVMDDFFGIVRTPESS